MLLYTPVTCFLKISHSQFKRNIVRQHSLSAKMTQSAPILIIIIFSSWVPRVSAEYCDGYYGQYKPNSLTKFECKLIEALDLLVPAAWIAAVGILLLGVTVSKDLLWIYTFR